MPPYSLEGRCSSADDVALRPLPCGSQAQGAHSGTEVCRQALADVTLELSKPGGLRDLQHAQHVRSGFHKIRHQIVLTGGLAAT